MPGALGDPQNWSLRWTFCPRNSKNTIRRSYSDKVLNPLTLLWKKIREIRVSTIISPLSKENRCSPCLLDDRANPIWLEIQENLAIVCLISPCFALWHGVKYVSDSHGQEGILRTEQAICGNNTFSTEDTKFRDNASKRVAGKGSSFMGCQIMDRCSLKRP